MNNSILIGIAILTGALIPIQLVFNAELGSVAKSPYSAGFIIFLTGVVSLAVIIMVTRPALPTVVDLKAAPITVWLGGVIATWYIISVVMVTPKLGVGLTTGLILIGQLIMALLLDHLGALPACS